MKLPQFNNKPTLLRATYHINTPMFVAGADPKEAELTPTSFKGVMRFWWRALNWSHIRLESPNKEQALKELHEQEAKLFGVASSDARVKQKLHNGQGACFINALSLLGNREWNYTQNLSGVNYLLGQGLFRGNLTRKAFSQGQTFTVDLTVGDNLQSIQDVLRLIGLLGSFGSRSRHGFGSVTLIELACKNIGDDEYQSINFEQDLKTALTKLFEKYNCRRNTELPPLSAFYQGTRVDLVEFQGNDVVQILGQIGKNQQLYRSYGSRNPRTQRYEVDGREPERKFEDDHDLILRYIDDRNYQGGHPRRAVFGLPHNYRYSSGQSKRVDAKIGRRASPLIQHIHCHNHQFLLVHCLLESEFLPQNDKIKIGSKEVNVNVDYGVIKTFMNRFNNRETLFNDEEDR